MTYPKHRRNIVFGLMILVVASVGFLAFRNSSTKNTQPPPFQNSKKGEAIVAKPANVVTNDFQYLRPAGWAILSKDDLDARTAASGIGRIAPKALFTIKVSTSVPGNDGELKSSTLDDIKKNAPNFKLLSSVSTRVDSQSGQVFTYTFTDKDGNNKLRQQLSAIPYKGKTFFLLFSSADSGYDSQSSDFANILNGFKFK